MSNRQEKKALRALGNISEPDELVIQPLSGDEYEFFPSGQFVLAAVVAISDRTAGGIVVPEKAREGRMPRWEILAVGPGGIGPKGERVPINVKVGDQVLLAPQLGAILEMPDHARRTALVHESAIISVVKPKLDS